MGELEHQTDYVPVVADLINLDPRFANYLWVEAEGGCWEFTGYIYAGGPRGTTFYGSIWYKGRNRTGLAHRWVYELFWGKIPSGYEVHHTCNNGICCNPSHLEALDPLEHDRIHGRVRTPGTYRQRR